MGRTGCEADAGETRLSLLLGAVMALGDEDFES